MHLCPICNRRTINVLDDDDDDDEYNSEQKIIQSTVRSAISLHYVLRIYETRIAVMIMIVCLMTLANKAVKHTTK